MGDEDRRPEEGDAAPTDETGAGPRSAAEELEVAFGHLRTAAKRLVEETAKDPAVRNAANEAERVIHEIGDRAEPLARQMGDEIGRWSRRFSDMVQSAVDDLQSRSTGRDDDSGDDDGGDDGARDDDAGDDDEPSNR